MDLIITIILVVCLIVKPKEAINGYLTGLKEGLWK